MHIWTYEQQFFSSDQPPLETIGPPLPPQSDDARTASVVQKALAGENEV